MSGDDVRGDADEAGRERAGSRARQAKLRAARRAAGWREVKVWVPADRVWEVEEHVAGMLSGAIPPRNPMERRPRRGEPDPRQIGLLGADDPATTPPAPASGPQAGDPALPAIQVNDGGPTASGGAAPDAGRPRPRRGAQGGR